VGRELDAVLDTPNPWLLFPLSEDYCPLLCPGPFSFSVGFRNLHQGAGSVMWPVFEVDLA